ncbi:MAG: hypothetical protein GC179_12930 [Anaerolineaceae bacterium]|nr:hypothetical protein [Anaerolineaceae bacterium]
MGHDKPEPKRRTGTETGLIQRVENKPDAAYEPPQPPTIPEFDSGGITGVMPLKAEGEDAAKQQDDTTSTRVNS